MRSIAVVFAALLTPGFSVLAQTPPSAPALERRELTFEGAGGVRLSGTLLLPTGRAPETGGKLPAIAFLQGSGDGTRDWSEPIAARLAASGFAALVFDKRGSGKSAGSWKTSSLEDLAGDGAAAVRFLAAVRDVDANRVGVFAISQSGWYAPLVAARAPVAFLVVVTGGGIPPREVEWFGYERKLAARGVSGQDRERALALVKSYFDYLATGTGLEELRREISSVSSLPWYDAVRIGDVLPGPDSRAQWAWVPTFDPAPSIEALHVPVLVLLAGSDPFVPASAEAAWTRSLARSRAAPVATVRTFPEAGHGMRVGEHGHGPQVQPRWAVGYVETLLGWLERLER
jgi:uncharacterized protein